MSIGQLWVSFSIGRQGLVHPGRPQARRFHHDEHLLRRHVREQGPVEGHVGRSHKVLDKGEDAEGCENRDLD